jgi:putative chitinase
MGFQFNFTQDQLQQFLPQNQHVEHWFEALAKILPDYDITTVPRVASFLGETYVESAAYTAIQENLNYRPETLMKIFGNHFPGGLSEATQYCNQPNKQEAIANRIYANRMGNGPEESGDGWKFCGRGLIQLTGRSNYTKFAESLSMNVDDVPEFLQTFEGCVQSACWFWEANNLNQYADQNAIDHESRIVNGGTLGLQERRAAFERAVQILQS